MYFLTFLITIWFSTVALVKKYKPILPHIHAQKLLYFRIVFHFLQLVLYIALFTSFLFGSINWTFIALEILFMIGLALMSILVYEELVQPLFISQITIIYSRIISLLTTPFGRVEWIASYLYSHEFSVHPWIVSGGWIITCLQYVLILAKVIESFIGKRKHGIQPGIITLLDLDTILFPVELVLSVLGLLLGMIVSVWYGCNYMSIELTLIQIVLIICTIEERTDWVRRYIIERYFTGPPPTTKKRVIKKLSFGQ